MDLLDLRDFPSGLSLGPHEHVAVVGGGGKTTLVHALGRGLTGSRILTTTTKMGFDQGGGLPTVLLDRDPSSAAVVAARDHGLVMVWAALDEPVALGVDPELCDEWFRSVDHVVVEADGARRRPFKAPAHYEPVVPRSVTIVVSTIGADALDDVIERCCHRPEIVADLAGCEPTDRLTPERAAKVLLHERGNRRAVPPGARFAVATTKVDARRRPLVDRLDRALAAGRSDVLHLAVEQTAF